MPDLHYQPLVTVYMPTHNRASLVVRAIKSILGQSYKNIEIIVVDDGSTDNTTEALKTYAERRQIIYLKNDTPKGAPFSRNRAINQAKGELITGLDDDDFFLPTRIQMMVKAFDSSDSFVSTGYKVQSVNDTNIVYATAMVIDLDGLLLSNIIGNQILVRTNILRELGGFDESLPAWQDYDMWIRLVRRYGPGRRINFQSYVVDKSHTHERISTNVQKIRDAYDRFVSKHPEYSEKRYLAALKTSVIQYDIRQLKFKDVVSVFLVGAFKKALGLIWARFKVILPR